ncbi:MAG: hypothetical protein P8101_05385 [Candidatus Thiodiazotropha sp.]
MQQDIQSSTTQPVQTHIENRDTGAQERGTAQQETASVESRYHKTSLDVFTDTPTKFEHASAQKTALEQFVGESITNRPGIASSHDVSEAQKTQVMHPQAKAITFAENTKQADKVQDQPANVLVRMDSELNQRLHQSAVPTEVKESIINHFNSLDTDRARQDAKLLKQALDGDGENADRAIITFDRITRIPDEKQRLTEGVKSALIQGVAQRAMPAKMQNGVNQSTGQAGVLGVVHAQRAAEAITKMDDKQYRNLTNALNQTGGAGAHGKRASEGADVQSEQALILKAVGARGGEFGDPESAAEAMKEVIEFADKIRGMERSDLLNRTTTIDIDIDRSTSDIRSTGWDSNRNEPLDLQLGDNASKDPYKKDNDTLTQRGRTYCVPTISQITHGYADPVFAFERSADANNVSTTSETAKQQNMLFDRNGGHEKSGGVDNDDVPKVLNDLAQAGVEYKYNHAKIYQRDLVSNLKRSFLIDKQFQKIDSLLRNGQTVPLAVQGSVSDEGHLMLISDVRGSGDSKRYLLSDPASGRTTWVSSNAMRERKMPNWHRVDIFPGYGLSVNNTQMRVHIQGFYEEVPAAK